MGEPRAFLTSIVVFSTRHKNHLKVIALPETLFLMCPNKTFGFAALWGKSEVTGKSYYSLLARVVIHMLITRKPFSFLGLLCVCVFVYACVCLCAFY